TAYPLQRFLGSTPDGRQHPVVCDQACYLCLHRYGNQMFHGLLDWRLGLAFLAALDDSSFDCGLTGGFEAVPRFLADWPHWAEYYAREMQRRFAPRGEVRQVGRLWAFRFDRSVENWALVVHPLWDVDGVHTSLVAEALDALNGPGANIQ